MKVNYTRVLARNILLTFLAFIIILSIAAFFVHRSITKKLEAVSHLSDSSASDSSRADDALMLLHEADNFFQQSLINSNRHKTADYKKALSEAFIQIDTLLNTQADTLRLTVAQRLKVRDWYIKKIKLSNDLFVLKHSFDSLLTVYAGLGTISKIAPHIPEPDLKKGEVEVQSTLDTIKKVEQKRGLFKRLKDAIKNKETVKSEIIYKTKVKEIDTITRNLLNQTNTAYNEKLKLLQKRNANVLNTQSQLIALNTHIINELASIVSKVKDMNYAMSDKFKGMAINSYEESTALLNKLYIIALVLVICVALLLIIFIIRLNKSESLLRKEVERSVAIAQQKMDLLHHMSHEIRNPLTAIQGFLYIFSKSNMSAHQVEMLESITLSSEMVLRTLNDTLDAAKMESSEIKINPEPFNPYFVIEKTIESMRFSASQKELSITYNFSSEKELDLFGDSFRLKQILINLLSNAIKYTNKGGITVDAQVLDGSQPSLHVSITDTGIGIAPEQQENLFSKYYQTDSSKGQTGTGLGLFICKQLVILQDGKIGVKSNLGVGTTFTFVIPYQKSDISAKCVNDDSILGSLNGTRILAVDDNPINLLYLKKLTEKWDVIYHQATDGFEALELISKYQFKVILSDLQMPEMDGEVLLSKIKELDAPNNAIPVIVISGNITVADQQRLYAMGFSGIISKPFVEADIMDQLTLALTKRYGAKT